MKVSQLFSYFYFAVALGGVSISVDSLALAAQGGFKAPSISSQELASQIESRISRVEEFRFIREEAERLGVRAWLFGGTAAGYGHYVKWDLQREKGDPRFQPDRFDYDYSNIYRSTQDLDIVIDGSPEKAQALQSALQVKYPHLQGSKTAWEVRLLSQDMGDKQALLNNPDFLNQHTDSNSTGMIEITKPPTGEKVVRDLRDWESRDPNFLKDLREGALHYYFSPEHEETKFFKAGRNPPILSAIRYLTKAFQYELKLRPEDLTKIREVIDEFDPKAPLDSYVSNWIEKNGKKLIQNAVNIEYAVKTLDELGLRKKLSEIKGNARDLDSLAWWMNKEPLNSSPVGQGKGQTAAEIWKAEGFPVGEKGQLIVGHETGTFLAYESITRAHTGDPNVLISRGDAPGEAALFGNGFYTKVGRSGARGTGLTIRFTLDPNAREGTDFTRSKEFIVLRNKSAIRVIPESLNIGPLEYFDMLIQGQALSRDDRGILEKLKRRIGPKLYALSTIEKKKLAEKVRPHLADNETLMQEWFSLPISSKYPESVQALVDSGRRDPFVVRKILSQPHWRDHPEWVETILKRKTADLDISEFVLTQPHSEDHPEWVETLLKRGTVDSSLVHRVLTQPHWKDHKEWITPALIKRAGGPDGGNLARYILGHPRLKDHPEWVKSFLRMGTVDPLIAELVLSQPHWKDHSEWVLKLIENGDQTTHHAIAKYVLSQPHWDNHPELVEALLSKRTRGTGDEIAQWVLSRPEWSNHPEWVMKLLDRKTAQDAVAAYVLSQPHSRNHPEFVETLIKNGNTDKAVATLSYPHWSEHPELVRALIEMRKVDKEIVQWLLSQPHWSKHPEFVETLIKRGKTDEEIAEHVLSKPHWSGHPEWVETLLKRGKADGELVRSVLSRPHWSDHPEWVNSMIKRGQWDEQLATYVLSEPFSAKHPEWVDALLKKESNHFTVTAHVLSKPHSKEHPEWIEAVLRDGKSDADLANYALNQPHWREHPELRRIVEGEVPTVENLRAGYQKLRSAPRAARPVGCSEPFARLAP